MHIDNYLNLEFASSERNLGPVKLAVGAFASHLGFTIDEIDDIKLAISEAVTNCIIHGYPSGGGVITVLCRSVEGAFELTVKDQGVGIADIAWARQATNTTIDERMGIGLTVIEEVMDSIVIESGQGTGTVITMVKRPVNHDL